MHYARGTDNKIAGPAMMMTVIVMMMVVVMMMAK